MKGLGGGRRKRQGSYDIAQGAQPVVSPVSLTAHSGVSGSNNTVVLSRQVTLQDILDLTASSSGSITHSGRHNNSLEAGPGDLDFESSRVIVVNTKGGKRGARKRALSVSPRLGSRGSAVGSSCGSVADTGGTTARGGGGAGGFYTWMQSSLRRRLRKRPKKSTLPRSQTPPPPPRHRTQQPDTRRQHLEGVVRVAGGPLEGPEVVSLSASEEGFASSPATPTTSTSSSPPHGEVASRTNYCNSTPSPACSASRTPQTSTTQPPCGGCRNQQTQERVTYVNHRNGSVTAVSAATILQALTSASSGTKTKAGGAGGGTRDGSGRLSHSARGRSTSVGRRVALSTTLTAAVAATSSGNKKGNNKKKGRKHRVFGGAWGLFHCAGAGARSRSCTPERNVNFRVRSRSATPERYLNVRINPPTGGCTAGGAGRKPGSMKLVKSKRKSKSSRRRFSTDSDEEANKENKYDMWGFIKERLEGGSRSGRPCAAERLSRRDTLPCRPRGSVNINRGDLHDTGEFFPPDLPPAVTVMTRSVSEKRYDHRAAHLPPTDMCTYIHRVPPTTDVNFNNYGSVLSMHLKKGETLPLNLQKSADQTSVASSLNSVGSKDSKDSGVSSSSSCSSSTTSTSRVVARGGGWADSTLASRDRTNTLPVRYWNRPLPPIPKPELPPKPPESGIHLVKTLKLDKFMKNKWISGVSVTRKNDLVVVDLKEAYLIDEDGNLKRTIGTSGKGALKEPIDVAVMANGNVAVSDHADQEVKVFTTKGQFVRRVMDKCLANIAGVATGDRRVFIAGTDKRCITVHSEEEGYLYSIPSKENTAGRGGSTKNVTSGYGTSSGSGLKELFEHPYSIAVNPLTGDIIVGDDYKQRVVALSPDGRVLWRYSPTGDRHFFPCSIAVDSEGYIFIADLYNEKVYMLDSSGKHLKVLLSRGEGLKGGPGAIAVDGRGHLVVADEERTLQVFKYGDKGFALYRRFSMCPDAK